MLLGTLQSALGISAEVVENTYFLVDRFLFAAHKSSRLATHAGSRGNQEQINSMIRLMERTFRGTSESGSKNLTVVACIA